MVLVWFCVILWRDSLFPDSWQLAPHFCLLIGFKGLFFDFFVLFSKIFLRMASILLGRTIDFFERFIFLFLGNSKPDFLMLTEITLLPKFSPL